MTKNSSNSQSDAIVTTLASRQMLLVSTSHNEKSSKFFGENFEIWQQKILCYLTMLSLVKFFKNDPPTIREDEVDVAITFNVVENWKHYDFLSRNTF